MSGSEGFELRGSLGESFLGLFAVREQVAEGALAIGFGFVWPALNLRDVSAHCPFSFLRNADWIVDSSGRLSFLPKIMLLFILIP